MGKKLTTHKSLITLMFSLFSLFIVSFGFNNCSGVGQTQSSQQVAQMSYDTKVNALKQIQQNTLSSDFCLNSKNYSCQKKNFSTSAEKNETLSSQSVCFNLPEGTSICPVVDEFIFATASAQSHCQENCTDQFDYEEYDCHLKLSLNADGLYPLVSTASSLQTSLETLYKSCLEIQKGMAQ